jgi:ABC-type nitrate/sulfonate/bicarbonate transport system ATPase subunit
MISVKNLSFEYQRGHPIFQDFSWGVQRGETWAVLGASGCGKSTLLYLLAGLRQAASGTISIDGQELRRPRPHTGLIIQDYGLLPWATVRQNAGLGWRVRSLYGPDGTHAPREPLQAGSVDFWLERLGLIPVASQYPGKISGGQRQRTAIARTLSLQPDLLLMDEPFSSLDAPTREDLQRLTLELWAEHHLTLVLVTHAIEEAVTLGGKILLLGSIPNSAALVFDNPGVSKADYRTQPEFSAMCRLLRSRMVG